MARQYITTAIDYPNAAPHMGHVLEKVLADVCARWFRLSGDSVRFQIGTDEHGIKIQRTADKAGVSPAQLVDQNVPLFKDLYSKLNISFDEFIRTTDQKKHWPTVQTLWKKLQDAGALEKRSYTGLYCSGCERFMTKKELVDGKCPIHGTVPEEVIEQNWFFKLKDQEKWLKKILQKEYKIIPEFRANETLALLDQGLEDVSFSRPKTSLSWGIPVPGDAEQVMYVWCDALTNYISGLGFFTKDENVEWWNDATVTHVIGKDIARFHALIWPAMLKNAGVKIPDQLLIHGFLTSGGEKMSKSTGNVVDPVDVLKRFKGNPDPLRFYLSHEVPVGNDGDFSWERIENLYDSKLRNQIGNLLNRVLILMQKDDGVLSIESTPISDVTSVWKQYRTAMNAFKPEVALQTLMSSIQKLNFQINEQEPWKMTDKDRRVATLSAFAEHMRLSALMLLPFAPETAQRISKQLNVSYADQMLERDFTIDKWEDWGTDKKWKQVGTPEILFPALDEIK